MRTHTPLLLAFALATGSAAHADERGGVAPYIGLDMGKSSVSSHVYSESNDPVFGAFLGLSFNPSIAVELFSRSLSFRLFDGMLGDQSYYPTEHVGISVLGTMPISEHLHLSGRLGVGRTRMRSGSVDLPGYDTTDPSVGGEFRYDFNNSSWSVKLGALHFTKTKVTTTTLGLAYRF